MNLLALVPMDVLLGNQSAHQHASAATEFGSKRGSDMVQFRPSK